MGRHLKSILATALLAGLTWAMPAPGAEAGPSPGRRLDPRGFEVRADCFELRLGAAASRAAFAVRGAGRAGAADALGSGAGPLGVAPPDRFRGPRLGVTSVDRAAAALAGTTFESEFRGEEPPHPSSGETDFAGFYRVHLPEGADLDAALARFRALPEVLSAEPIPVLPVSLTTPNDSLFMYSTWFYQPGDRRDVHAADAWDITTGDTSIVVAVLDTGVLPYHPDLSGTTAGLAGNLWTNWTEAGGVAGVDDDGNGYVDDVGGWDFVHLPSGGGVTVGEDWQDADADPNDFTGHGTKVAGIIGALTDNVSGVAGTAWKVRVMPLRVGWSEPGFTYGVVDMSYVAEAMRYATRKGASVFNCSFQTANLGGMLAAAAAATRAGVAIVVAAGNNGTPNHALNDREDVVSVAATDPNDVVAFFSNTGSYVDLSAPGVNVISTFVAHTGPDSIAQRQPSYDLFLDGTSFSAPIVAGAVALVQADRRAHGEPPLSAMDMLFRLRESADDIAALNPGDSGYGTGRLNVLRALTETSTSRAIRTGSRTVGPPVTWSTTSGAHFAAWAMDNNRLLVLDAIGDTVANVALPGRPALQPAMADMGGGFGIALFVGTVNGRVAGFDRFGTTLAGWPATDPGPLAAMTAGPALGDLNGDGVREIVSGGADGSVWAWNTAGDVLPGFPVATSLIGPSGPLALGDLDGVPGDEIVMATRDGSVFAFDGTGSPVAGWPVSIGASASSAPVIARWGADTTGSVVVAGGNVLHALGSNGAPRFTYDLGAEIAFEPALADLGGDGSDEVILAGVTGSTYRMSVIDAAGVVPVGAGWPLTLPARPTGAPVVGPLRSGGGLGIACMLTTGIAAFDDSARAIPGYPYPGLAGSSPALFDVDGDGHTEVLAGTGPDSLLYMYDAGAQTWVAAQALWPVHRGDNTRRGSRLAPPPPIVIDDVAPAALTLAPDSIGTMALAVRWVASGDDGLDGQAAAYQLQVTTDRASAGLFTNGVRDDLAPPDSSGTAQRAVVTGLRAGVTYYFALRARDEAGNWSASSAVLALVTRLGHQPGLPPGVVALRAVTQPARIPVGIEWQGVAAESGPENRITIYDVGGRVVRDLAAGRESGGILKWDGRDRSGARVPAGLYFSRLSSGGAHAEARIVVLP